MDNEQPLALTTHGQTLTPQLVAAPLYIQPQEPGSSQDAIEVHVWDS